MAKNTKVSATEARQILDTTKSAGVDFHALRSDTVRELLDWADAYGYRAPANANGSRGLYFHSYLERIARGA